MSIFVVAGIVLSGAWTQLDSAGWPVVLVLAAIVALDRLAPSLPGRLITWRPSGGDRGAVVIAALLCALHIGHVALTAREEFGFSGDEGYHLSATRAFAIYFLKAGPALAAVALLFGALRYAAIRYAASVTAIALLAVSLWLPNDALFGRYPTAFYLLATPLNVAFEAARVPYPFTANHVVNALSVPAWLFVLRPLLIGRWPDWRVVPVALLVYFQAPSFVYAGSALLEPWSFVFVLLALEGVAAFDDDRKWLAVLLAAAATWFKETAVLFLPPIWLLAMVRVEGRSIRLRPHAITAGMAAVIPFITYYAIRRGLHIIRGYDVASSAGVWTLARAETWLLNTARQLGAGGTIGMTALALSSVAGLVLDRRNRLAHAVWIAASLGIAVFFAADSASIPFTGYGRFAAYSLLALCGGAFAAMYRTGDRRMLMAAAALLLAAQVIPVTRVLALDLRPDYERNSLEWAHSLIRYPIRSLTDRLGELPGAAQVRRIRVVSFGVDLISLRVAYPDLARRFELIGEMQPPTSPQCSCASADEAVLAVFEWPAHFSEDDATARLFRDQQRVCVAQMERTCTALIREPAGGDAAGILGIGR